MSYTIFPNSSSIMLFFLFSFLHTFVQNNLIAKEKQIENDTVFVNKLNRLAVSYIGIKSDSAILLGQEAFDLSAKLNYSKGKLTALRNLGGVYLNLGEYEKARSYYLSMIDLAKKVNDHKNHCVGLSQIGSIFIQQGKYDTAIQNFDIALHIAEKYNLKLIVAFIHYNLGSIYSTLGKSAQAISNLEKSRSIYEANGDSTQSSIILGILGNHYLVGMKDVKKADILFQQSIKLAMRSQNKKTIAHALIATGSSLRLNGNMNRALPYFYQAKTILESIADKAELISVIDHLSKCYLDLNDRNLALKYGKQTFQLANELGHAAYIQQSANTLYLVFERSGNYKMALYYLKKSYSIKDQLYHDKNKEELVRMEEKYKFEKQQQESEVAYKLKLERKQKLLYTSAVLTVALIMIALLLYRNIQQKKKNNKILHSTKEFIEEQNILLEGSNELKRNLISVMVHDIRQPISSLKNVLKLFDENLLTYENVHKMMMLYRSEIDSIVNFIDDFMLWTTLLLHNRKIAKSEFQIALEIKKVYTLFKEQAELKKVKLKFDINENLWVYADKGSIGIVLRNIVGNAVKYCKTDGIIQVCCTYLANEHRVQISVIDTGTGMAQDFIEKLFAENNYISNLGTNGEKGNGIGLQLCQFYLKQNNSELFLESLAGKGSRFWFYLPIEKPHEL